MNKALFFLAPALVLSACSPAATTETDKSAAEPSKEVAMAKAAAAAAPVDAAYVPPGDLTDAQKTMAVDMHNLVLDRAILGRLADKCPEVSIDEAKMTGERDRLVKQAQTAFKSQEDYMVAAGMNEQDAMAEKVKQFYAKQHVTWDSSSAEYCAVGKTLKGLTTGAGRYLK